MNWAKVKFAIIDHWMLMLAVVGFLGLCVKGLVYIATAVAAALD